ncbi:MAG: hypothetical protein P8Q42_08575 [Flavobacteriales bacterium]|nr:hypothetical protein [Flavobacteriales bacterium]
MKNAVILFLFAISLLSSCTEERLNIDTSGIDVHLNFKHYEQDLFTINRNNIERSLDELSLKHPIFISGDYKNPSEIHELNTYLNNELNTKLFKDWQTKIGTYDAIETELNKAFSYFKHYYPNDSNPSIYTYISGVNYEKPIIIKNNNIIIGIDMFYGKNYKAYQQLKIPQYLSKSYDKKYITPIVFREFITQKFAPFLAGKTMLDNMISLGKVEYFIEAVTPQLQDSIRFQFTTSQMNWCYGHERAFWKHLTIKGLLFSNDYHAYKRFLQPGPFASSMERESPARIGIYIGYRIVKDFMDKNTEVSLNELMTNTDFTAIFKASKYNP